MITPGDNCDIQYLRHWPWNCSRGGVAGNENVIDIGHGKLIMCDYCTTKWLDVTRADKDARRVAQLAKDDLIQDLAEANDRNTCLLMLLHRLRGWDQMNATHEGVAWRTEIDAALATLAAP